MLSKELIEHEANVFRDAIDRSSFDLKDRMSGFPRGCCDDATDLFANYLFEKYDMVTVRVDGSFYPDNFDERDWHTWLEIGDVIVDLSADQYSEYDYIYVGEYDVFHKRYELEKREYIGFKNFSDSCWERMERLYKTIISNIAP